VIAMMGTASPRSAAPGLGTLIARLHDYQAVRVSEFESVVLIPRVGSVLVDARPTQIVFHLAADSQAVLDRSIAALHEELSIAEAGNVSVDWMPAASLPVPLT
jgi:hypothetical protein